MLKKENGAFSLEECPTFRHRNNNYFNSLLLADIFIISAINVFFNNIETYCDKCSKSAETFCSACVLLFKKQYDII